MRIGVCIPCHEKHIKYIPQCLESIEHQTRKPDLVCIGIGSTVLSGVFVLTGNLIIIIIVHHYTQQLHQDYEK